MMRSCCFLSFLLLISPVLYAAPETYVISTDKTAIGFPGARLATRFLRRI